MNDIIIIGAGVAGLTAAIYAARAGKKVLVLESKVAGGQIVQAHDVRNWPGAQSISGEELTKNIYQQAKALGVEFEFAGVTAVKKQYDEFEVVTDEDTYWAKTIIVATGSQDRPLGLLEEEKYLNHGLSYCVTCDGALFKDKDVAVVGGGNTAFYDVLYLANIARRVYLIHRSEKFRADATLVERVRKLQNVQILMHWTVKALNGEQNLESVTLQLTLDAQGGDKKSSKVEGRMDDKKQFEVGAQGGDKKPPETWTEKVSGLFVAIGREPATQVFRGLVKMDAEGYIVADEDGATSEPGVFVAGDCRTKKVRQLVTAAADGANAATAAVNYLNRER